MTLSKIIIPKLTGDLDNQGPTNLNKSRNLKKVLYSQKFLSAKNFENQLHYFEDNILKKPHPSMPSYKAPLY